MGHHINANESLFAESNGCRLAFQLRGQGPPVLFIQGVGVHGDGWLPQVDGLAARFRCLTFDNRGIKHREPDGERLSVAQMADDALAVMNSQSWESAHVVGHSLGGLIALRLALSARERVRSLSLLCTFSCGRDATRPSLGMIWTGLRTRIGTRRQRRRAFLKLVLSPAAQMGSNADHWAERLAPIFGHDLADHPPIVMKQLKAMREYDATPHLNELSGVPALVISASHDRIARPDLGRSLASKLSRARYLEISDAAHGVTIERAEEINQLLTEHFSEVEMAGS